MMDRASLDKLVIEKAYQWIGTPYHHQMAVKGIGCDCVGIIRGIYSEIFEITPEVPPYSIDWGDSNGNETLVEAGLNYLVKTDEISEGSILGIRWGQGRVVKHVMIYCGDNICIHAHSRRGVVKTKLSHFKDKIAIVFKFPLEV